MADGILYFFLERPLLGFVLFGVPPEGGAMGWISFGCQKVWARETGQNKRWTGHGGGVCKTSLLVPKTNYFKALPPRWH